MTRRSERRTTDCSSARRIHRQAVREQPTATLDDNLQGGRDDFPIATAAHQLVDSIRALSPHQRNILLLFVSGHSYREIAIRHGLSTHAVNKALVRARSHLRAVHDAN